MKKIKRYKEFISEELTADMPPKATTEIHTKYESPSNKYSTEDTYVFNPSDTLHKVTKSKSEMQKMTKYAHWTLDSTHVDTLWKTVVKRLPSSDTNKLDIKFNIDGSQFITGGFRLSQSVINNIKSEINGVTSKGGIITDFQIESSTDKEPINMEYKGKSGNKALALRRADAVKSELINLGISDSIISVEANEDDPNGAGPDIYNKNMSDAERENARINTQEFRYVTVSITYIQIEIEDLPILIEVVPQLKNTYYLSKPFETGGIDMGEAKVKKHKKTCKTKDTKRYNGKTECTFLND